MGVGLEHPATEKNAQGNGRRMPSRAPAVIIKKGQEEGVTGPTVGMYLTGQAGGVERERKEAR